MVDISSKVLLQNIAFKIFDGSTQVVWTSIINAMIILPFILLFTFSGYLSDKYDKKNILIYGALSSFLLSLLSVVSYMSANYYFSMFTLLLLAIQSTIYSPAKFGIIISIYGKDNLSKGNAHLQAITIIAMLLAMALTSFIFEDFFLSNNLQNLKTKEELLYAITPLTYYILPLSFTEFLVSFLILKKINTSHINTKSTYNKRDIFKLDLLKSVTKEKIIFLSVLGLSVFWAISQGLIVVFPAYAKEYINITSTLEINMIIGASGIGIAIGSFIYSKLSKYYIELGTIPIASIGMSFAIYLSLVFTSVQSLAFAFFLFGFFGGMFIVPLNSLIQFNAKKNILGSVLASNNWFQSIAMLIMLIFTSTASLYYLNPLYSLYIILFVTSSLALFIFIKQIRLVMLMFLKLLMRLKYSLEIQGFNNIAKDKGVLLLGNHISWIDWAIILSSSQREVRFVIEKDIYEKWFINWIFKIFHAIPISSKTGKDTIKKVAKVLDEGYVVVIFPEGSISRDGKLDDFKKGFEKILEFTVTDIEVVSFYIHGLWGCVFSRASKEVKKNSKIRKIKVNFSKAISKEDANAISIRNEVEKLRLKN